RAPIGRMTAALADAIRLHKPALRAVVERLDGMRATVGQVPVPCARVDATGGPGRCFSCGDALAHPACCRRGDLCALAIELLYHVWPGAADLWEPCPTAVLNR